MVAATKSSQFQIGWLEKTLSGISSSIEQAVFTEEHSHKNGWLQRIDPRAKLGMFLCFVLAASLSRSFFALLICYLVLLLAARASLIPFDFFVRRVWIGIPFFAGIVMLPAIFFTNGPRLFDLPIGLYHFGPSIESIWSGCIFILRVGVSVSLAVLLILTTPWADLLKSLQALRVPAVFTLLLSMTYRYIFLFLHTANGMFEARKSRTVGRTSGREQRQWISGSMGSLMHRSFRMSNEVYAAMMARGFTGQIRSYSAYRMRWLDWLALGISFLLSIVLVISGGYLR
ncbi:cobalt ECF transporter T component CbiQ [Tengunoibacter tsumagoiensis]|uniref:Cobalt ECF transporter T component CbiQ n=1 Tax=Tengunoibacter tsumagoiensis TaxID=2014871 RepID=A0A402AA46_9CHLR|nr:cobalt ECF transporter T component CbiQ [Tengunoibacter tsumagoiensis]GCE16047.1 cobalt ECF transporter T component CbiQ [Tengunoibacter tsumagoiensis]